jgi:MoxR-like ATPase
MDSDIREITQQVEKESVFIQQIEHEVGKVIVGQKYIIDRLVVGLLADGHILLEGVPGLAKTLAVKTLSDVIQAKFQRIQFTPDLLPADLTGTSIYNPRGEEFSIKKGPIFANLILADEVNRAPAKVQSALLEAMQERQVTISDTTFPLPMPFLVMATQNPIEQEGTYPLPEAQVDRFMLKLRITYPTRDEERRILERMTTGEIPTAGRLITPEEILKARRLVPKIYMDEKIKNYVLDIVFATRQPDKYRLGKLQSLIAYGASPRATLALTLAGKAYAFLQGRGYVTPDDIKSIGPDVLRHRIIITYEAEAQELTSEDIIRQVFNEVVVP